MGVTDATAQWLLAYVGQQNALTIDQLNLLLRRLAIWRSTLIANTYFSREGAVVREGPFQGMDYATGATEGALAPRPVTHLDRAPEFDRHVMGAPEGGGSILICSNSSTLRLPRHRALICLMGN